MNKRSQARYSLKPSGPFLIQMEIITLIINLGLFLIIYFLIDPLFQETSNPDLISKVVWASYVFISFVIFASVYMGINSVRYWIDFNRIEIMNSFRPKRKKIIPFEEIDNLRIVRTPFGDWFNYGTILFEKIKANGKKKTIARFWGVRFPEEVLYDLMESIQPETKDELLVKEAME